MTRLIKDKDYTREELEFEIPLHREIAIQHRNNRRPELARKSDQRADEYQALLDQLE